MVGHLDQSLIQSQLMFIISNPGRLYVDYCMTPLQVHLGNIASPFDNEEMSSEGLRNFPKTKEFPGGLVVRTPCFHCKEARV